ncbi:MAG: hypothetical protein WCI03_06805 [bacterium]|jgi:hypothetical protein
MNFFKSIKNLFSRKPAQSGQPAYVYVYSPGKDASNSEVNPNDQVAILRRLSSFVSKKNSPVTIIFPGRPSRKIPDGAKQDGVQARFATSDQLTKVVKESITEFQKTHSIVLAADRSEFQRLADKLGIRYSFASTFTKTLDSVCGAIQREPKPQSPRRQPQPPKNATQPNTVISDTTQLAATTKPDESTTPAPTNESPAIDSIEPATEHAEPESDTPASSATPSSRPKLHRHVPSQKRELTDRAILDLIDPL